MRAMRVRMSRRVMSSALRSVRMTAGFRVGVAGFVRIRFVRKKNSYEFCYKRSDGCTVRLLDEQELFGVDQSPDDVAITGSAAGFDFGFGDAVFRACCFARQDRQKDDINAIVD